jgi:ATP-dependent Clp protease adaptor protein ClpS
LSNPAGLTTLGGIAEPGIGPPLAAFDQRLRACGEPETDPYCNQSVQLMDRAGRERRSGKRVRDDGLDAVWFTVGISNACAMLQLTSTSDSSGRSATAAAVPRMGNDDNRAGGAGGPATSVIAKVKPKTKRPNLYRVLILNDDYTPMEFVVHVLEKFFQKDVEAATKIMLHVHHHGIGECGVFTYEIAETKVTQVMDFARKHQHPLQCVMEKK